MRVNSISGAWFRLATVILSSMAWSVASASSVIKLDDQAMTALAGYIVRGTVTSTRSEWNAEQTQIHTIVEIGVSETLKGKLQDAKKLTLRVLGGQVGDRAIEVVGGPVFTQGEEVILFLDKDPQRLLPVIGLYQGKLTIKADPTTGTKIVEGRNTSPEEFLQTIRNILTVQEAARNKAKEDEK